MLLVKVCRYAVVDADFYRGWDIVMRENCMCQCYIVDVPRHCTGTRNYSQEQQRDVSIMLSFFIRLLKILFSSSLGEAPAVRIWVKESGFTL